MPEIFATNCLIIDDNDLALDRVHSKELQDKGLYQVLRPATLEVGDDSVVDEQYFGSLWIEKIQKAFPNQL